MTNDMHLSWSSRRYRGILRAVHYLTTQRRCKSIYREYFCSGGRYERLRSL